MYGAAVGTGTKININMLFGVLMCWASDFHFLFFVWINLICDPLASVLATNVQSVQLLFLLNHIASTLWFTQALWAEPDAANMEPS